MESSKRHSVTQSLHPYFINIKQRWNDHYITLLHYIYYTVFLAGKHQVPSDK